MSAATVVRLGDVLEVGGSYFPPDDGSIATCGAECDGYFCTAPVGHERGDVPHVAGAMSPDNDEQVVAVALWDPRRYIELAADELNYGATL